MPPRKKRILVRIKLFHSPSDEADVAIVPLQLTAHAWSRRDRSRNQHLASSSSIDSLLINYFYYRLIFSKIICELLDQKLGGELTRKPSRSCSPWDPPCRDCARELYFNSSQTSIRTF